MRSSKFVLICTARYSDNLGDGVIAECAEFLVNQIDSEIHVRHLDIAGRTEYTHGGTSEISGIKKIFFSIPPFLKPILTLAAWNVFLRKKLDRAITNSMPERNFILLYAGGQIVSDIALNFPLKFSYITKVAESRDASIAAGALGVAGKFSKIGGCLFKTALKRKGWKYYGVRDSASRVNLDRLLGGSTVTETVDPAIWSAERYSVSRPVKSSIVTVGLGIAHPLELSAHMFDGDSVDEGGALRFWVGLVEKLIAGGKLPKIFTNGSREDNNFLRLVDEQLLDIGLSGKYVAVPPPKAPEDLVRMISGFDVVISHRLHANIISNSLAIPSVYLLWDKKVKDFAVKMGREAWCATTNDPLSNIVNLIDSAYAAGIDVELLKSMKIKSLTEMQRLLQECKQ